MSKPDLAAVFDHYEVKYNPNTSGNQAIQCPVHDDSHASASCNLSKEVWNCHACGEGGDSITLIMLKEYYGMEEDDHSLNITITREEIANIVGTATETVIRLMSDIRKEGMIKLDGKKIRIIKSEALLKLANLYD